MCVFFALFFSPTVKSIYGPRKVSAAGRVTAETVSGGDGGGASTQLRSDRLTANSYSALLSSSCTPGQVAVVRFFFFVEHPNRSRWRARLTQYKRETNKTTAFFFFFVSFSSYYSCFRRSETNVEHSSANEIRFFPARIPPPARRKRTVTRPTDRLTAVTSAVCRHGS